MALDARGVRRAGAVVLVLALALVTVWVGRTVLDGRPDPEAPVVDSLAFLRRALDGGSAEAAQREFPEGYFFSYALHALTWTELARDGRADVGTARREAEAALERLDSPAGRAPFTASLPPAYGIFHAGWTLLVRAHVAALDPARLDAAERSRLRADADAVATVFAARLDERRSPFPEAYPHQSWPVDSVVALAGLREADAVTGADHADLVDRWRRRAEELVDPRTGLLPHQTDPDTGALLAGTRGSSQSIIQRFWPTIDPGGHATSYRRFREQLVTSRLGFVGVREHPVGVDGSGDVDSGPLVLGFSASASAVTIGAARVNGDDDLAVALLHEVDTFGLPLTLGGERRYALGAVPIGDAFLAWARAAPPAPAVDDLPPLGARWPALLVVPWVVVGLAFGVSRRRRRRAPPPAR